MSEGRVHNPANKEPWLTIYELLGEYEDELGDRLDGVAPEGDWRSAYRARLMRVADVRRDVAKRGDL